MHECMRDHAMMAWWSSFWFDNRDVFFFFLDDKNCVWWQNGNLVRTTCQKWWRKGTSFACSALLGECVGTSSACSALLGEYLCACMFCPVGGVHEDIIWLFCPVRGVGTSFVCSVLFGEWAHHLTVMPYWENGHIMVLLFVLQVLGTMLGAWPPSHVIRLPCQVIHSKLTINQAHRHVFQ